MPLSEQTNHVLRPIGDHGEEVGDVATQHAHVKGFQRREGCELPTEQHLFVVLPG
jgi:hypothetical protein